MPCSFSDVTWTGRAALLISGHLRTVSAQVPTLRLLVRHNAPETQLDIFYHVWADTSGSECDRRALHTMRQVATAITFEPANCSWMWCNGDGFGCQWHSVDRGYSAFASLADPSSYSIVVRMRADLIYRAAEWRDALAAARRPQPKLPGALAQLWARYAEGDPLARARGNNFLVLGDGLNGWDMLAVGTPDVIRAYSAYSDQEGWGCDSSKDAFPWARTLRYGVWMDVNESSAVRDAERLNHPDGKRAMSVGLEAEPRCAPLHTGHLPFGMRRTPYGSSEYCDDSERSPPPGHRRRRGVVRRALRTTTVRGRHRDRRLSADAVDSWRAPQPRSSENVVTMEAWDGDRAAGGRGGGDGASQWPRQGRQLSVKQPPEVKLMSRAEKTKMQGYCALHQREVFFEKARGD